METIKTDTRALFEQIANRPLNPTDLENLILNVLIYRETKLRKDANDALAINLLTFSRAPIIDYIGDLVGAIRLAPTSASTEVTITLVPGHGGVIIPQGTRVASTDGLGVFALVEDVIVLSGINTATAIAICNTTGSKGNGYGPGVVSIIQDPYPYIASMVNTLTTAGGSEQETDELFRERIRLAPSQFTTAGSTDSYKFHAISATPVVIDCGVNSPINTGQVYLYPLMNDGSVTPTQVLDTVEAACSGERVRPLSDEVIMAPPTQIPYTLNVDLTLYTAGLGAGLDSVVDALLQTFTTEKRQKLGLDIVESQIKKIAQIEGVYKVELPGFSDIIVAYNEYAFCTSVTVTIIGSTNG